ncbi:hypothetical protein DCC39_17820 [Pueribacillus theae]|uniref:Uncharacterized protein n=1 Tax=Pueribacillus theae TaxID=2171751 RepID=A0A2U1JKV1_9BACI|nr:hypothetical protein [Pueribacillus theae]PWA05787.1 hypothetical protein DCC39_17820 [Pueribacillus theae]
MLYQKNWKNFIAYDYEKFKVDINQFIEKNNVKGIWRNNSGSWMLSNQKGYSYTSSHPVQFHLKITKATASPFERFLINFTGNGKSLENLCFIEIVVQDKENFPKIQLLFSQFFNQLDKKPWDLQKHPMFQFAWILKMKVKKRWEKFLVDHGN